MTAVSIDLPGILGSVLQVLVVGLLLGAGLPALFALGMRLLAAAPEHGPAPARAGAWTCFALCIVAAVAGIVVIVFGKAIFGG
ncbi:hypothetical protein [Microbacterium gilvum]|uniref:hypothetical protein n=1 Tax=Microbacterium gilvum TaxID=1336204 RepID=UPI0031ED97FA